MPLYGAGSVSSSSIATALGYTPANKAGDTFTSHVAVGTNPASAGAVRLANGDWLKSRNAANNGDWNMWRYNSGNWLEQGGYIYYDDSGDGYVDRNAVHHIRRHITLPTSVQPTLSILTTSYGDNTTFIGSSGITVTTVDPADVASGTKGVLYGVAAVVQPKINRNNVPFDDVACFIGQNDGTGKGTDAFYLGHGSGISGSNYQWIHGFLCDTNLNYAFRVSSGKTVDSVLRFDGVTCSGPAIFMGTSHSIQATSDLTFDVARGSSASPGVIFRNNNGNGSDAGIFMQVQGATGNSAGIGGLFVARGTGWGTMSYLGMAGASADTGGYVKIWADNMDGGDTDPDIAFGFGDHFSGIFNEKFRIGQDGLITIPGKVNFTGTTQSTVGAAGGASALPATPTGYLRIQIAGAERVIPYYAQA